MTPRVKICGLTTPEAVEAAAAADYAGFIFHPPSPRNLTPERYANLAAELQIPVVAVAVDPSDTLITDILDMYRPAYLQLHGGETPERVRQIKQTFRVHVIKAFRVTGAADIAQAELYVKEADMLMFDASRAGATFDWKLLAGFHSPKPWFLSGGLTEDNVEEALRISGARQVDVSSSLESAPGIKDPALVRAFIKKVKSITL